MTPLRKFLEMTKKDRERFDADFRKANSELFAAWDAERAKGYGGLGLGPDDVDRFDDINSKTYGGSGR